MCLFNHSLHFAEIKAVLEGRGFRPKTFGNRTRGAETAGRSYIYRTYRGILYIVWCDSFSRIFGQFVQ